MHSSKPTSFRGLGLGSRAQAAAWRACLLAPPRFISTACLAQWAAPEGLRRLGVVEVVGVVVGVGVVL
eukprot:3156603-Heterocapsa_arctica.AAC.1